MSDNSKNINNNPETCELSDSLTGIYIECLQNPESVRYNIPLLFKYPASEVDPSRLCQAFTRVTENYSAFRTVVRTMDSKPVLMMWKGDAPRIEVISMSDEELEEYKNTYSSPFTLDEGPLWKAQVISTPTISALILIIHHLVFDGTSTTVLGRLIADAYEGNLEAETTDMFDAAMIEADHRLTDGYRSSMDYFEDYLAGEDYDSTVIPDKPVSGSSAAMGSVYSVIDGKGSEIDSFVSGCSVSANVLFMGAFAYTLAVFNGQKNVQFCSVASGRYGGGYENSLGMFVRTFPLCFHIDETKSASEYLKEFKANYKATLIHSDASFVELAGKYGINSEIKFVYQGDMFDGIPVNGAASRVEILDLKESVSSFDLMVYRDNGVYVLWFRYLERLYTKELVESFADMYTCVLNGMLKDMRLCDIPLVSDRAISQINSHNDTADYHEETRTIGGVFEKIAAEYPQNTAVSYNNTSISYSELMRLTGALASYIRNQGIGKDEFVSVLIPRNEFMAITAMGIIRAGAAYQPLDPTYPVERLNFMVKDSGASLLIADPGLSHLITDYKGKILFTDEIAGLADEDTGILELIDDKASYQGINEQKPSQENLIHGFSDAEICANRSFSETDRCSNRNFSGTAYCANTNEASDISGECVLPDLSAKYHITPQDAAVILYTSGTTGIPKGTILEQRNILTFIDNHVRITGADSDTRMATYASFGFDGSMMDIFSTLLTGGALYVVPDEIRLDIHQIETFYNDNKITKGFMTTQVGQMFAATAKCPDLKCICMGGEKLTPFIPPEGVKCFNLYGPSETSPYVTAYRIKDNSSFQPVGCANKNTALYIRDGYGRLLPDGACGELCISGPQVGREYLGRPDKTAEAFVSNPYSDAPGYERMYRTGDIVRILPDGNVDFIGRRDGQVKIRGFRVELTEVEQVIRSFPGIINATVQAYDDAVAGKFIAAYITSEGTVNINELNSYILETKPPYMVPAVTMQLDAIPLNVNGKVDKKKLPKPEKHFEDAVKPRNEFEQKVFDVVGSIIGTEEFGVETDLIMAGLTSIGSIKLCLALDEKFHVTVKISDLRKYNTVAKLGEFIDANTATGPAASERMVYSNYPLTKTQEGIFAECIARPDSTFYNIPYLLRLGDGIDILRLKSAIVSAVNAHSYIKTVLFTDAMGEVRQQRNDDVPYTEADIEDITAATLNDIRDQLIRPFELTGGKLFNISLIHAENLYLFIDIHHIIADGTSMVILLRDIEASYNGEAVTSEKYNGYDVALSEESARHSTDYSEAKAYYTDILDGLDMDFLPRTDIYADVKGGSGHIIMRSEEALLPEIREYCEKEHISINGFMNAVFGLVLSKYNGTDYCVYNTVYNGRNDSRLTDTVSMLVKTLPVVCNIDCDTTHEYARNISGQLLDSMSHDLYSYAEIARAFGVRNDVMFIYQGEGFSVDSFCGEPSEEVKLALSESKTSMAMQVFVKDGHLEYEFEYDSESYTEGFIREIILSFDAACHNFINSGKMSEVSLLSPQMEASMEAYNDTEFDYDRSLTIVDHFISSAAEYPDKLCVACRDVSYTYSEVLDLSGRIASYLCNKGIGKGDVVAILINRDTNMVLTAFGVERSGAAYVGLDPTYPPERLEFMISDSGARCLILDKSLAGLIGSFDSDILYTDEIAGLSAPDEDNLSRVDLTPENDALIIYSSGTTGVPKGSVLQHKNIVCFYRNYIKDLEISQDSHVATYASFGFDGGAMDVFSAPMRGASLYVIPDEIRLDIMELEKFYISNSITNGFMTTQVGAMFISNTRCRSLRNFFVGGEKFINSKGPEWVRYVNGYGPSETMCYVNHYVIKDTGMIQPIGVVSGNTREYVVDAYMNRLPYGAAGELCISGGQTGRGYLNRPEKTAEVFVANPFCKKETYERMYRTGDIVRMLPDGNYDFVGRRDGQVKIRGFRIEISEVEQKIRDFEGVANVTVQAFDNPSGGKFLAAYIVMEEGLKLDTDALRTHITTDKPDYMVPQAMLQIEEIPLNSNGKIDKKALPKPEAGQQRKGIEPGNDTEKKICEIFSGILGSEKVYADDDFFEIGGSSISAIQVVVQCTNAGYDIVFKNLFANPTPQKLAAFINRDTQTAKEHGNSGEDVTGAARSGNNESETDKSVSRTVQSGNDGTEADISGTGAAQLGNGRIAADKSGRHGNDDHPALSGNIIENLNRISNKGVGNVLLTGATGFLGSHVLRELLNTTSGDVICLVRSKEGISSPDRVQMMMTYYFEDWYTEELALRVRVIDGELGDEDLNDKLAGAEFDTIINCAANVRHFAAGDALMQDNYNGVNNLIALAQNRNALLVQTSTISVAGESVDGSVPRGYRLHENELNIGQTLDNQYIYSKYLAEQAIMDAVASGKIRGKIVRLGNLMARSDDSEFQINAGTNGFLNQFSGFRKLGCFPIDMMDNWIEFSPIDAVARSVVLLAGTPDEFTVFHARNCNAIQYGYFLIAMKEAGLEIDVVENSEFSRRLVRALNNEEDVSSFTSFLAYKNNAGNSGEPSDERFMIDADTTFTTKALYRLGFAWPLISREYLERMVNVLKELDFF